MPFVMDSRAESLGASAVVLSKLAKWLQHTAVTL